MKFLNVLLLSSRITSILAASFILFFMLAHAIGNAEKSFIEISTQRELLLFLFFPLTTLTGLFLGWKYPLIGGLTTILGIIGFHMMGNHQYLSIIDVLGIPGLLFLVYVWWKSKLKS